jgi:hypothetical protein
MKALILRIFLIFFTASPLFVSAKMKKLEFISKFSEANLLMDERFWNQSINVWKLLLEEYPNHPNINYKLGLCYLETANSKTEALQYLEIACQKRLIRNYDPQDPTEKRAPVEALYHLGRAQALSLQIDAALATFEKVKKTFADKHRFHSDASHEIEMCNTAKEMIAAPKNFVITNVGMEINTLGNEYSPVLTLDETTMFFTSRRLRSDTSNSKLVDFSTGEYREDVYVSFKTASGTWSAPEMLNLSTDNNDATIGVSADGQTLFIYRDEFGDGMIYQSVLRGEIWQEPALLGSDINTTAWETHATMSADGNYLYFVSDRIGGEGGRDIYRCVKLPNGEWSKALNLGNMINTQYDEEAPFLTADGKTMYFSSKGHRTMGGFDIFVTKLGADGVWSMPENLGFPLNTVEDDLFFVPMADGRRGYLSSARPGGYGLSDIYLADLREKGAESQTAVLRGYIIGEEGTELPDDLRVIVTNNKTGEVNEFRPRKRDGAFLAVLNPCTSYKLEYFKGSLLVKDDALNIPCESNFQEIEREVYLLSPGAAKPKEVVPEEVPELITPVSSVEIKEFGFDSKDPVNRQYIADQGFAQYSRYFVYGLSEFGLSEPDFSQFVKDAQKIIKSGKKPIITIEASASKVPSAKFTNQQLVDNRYDKAVKLLVEGLAKAGFKEGENYSFGEPSKKVQGKEFENDAKQNRLLYEQFQYVKIKVKG